MPSPVVVHVGNRLSLPVPKVEHLDGRVKLAADYKEHHVVDQCTGVVVDSFQLTYNWVYIRFFIFPSIC